MKKLKHEFEKLILPFKILLLVSPPTVVFLHHKYKWFEYFWTSNPLEIEILGSGFIAVLILALSAYLNKISEYEIQRKDINNYFNEVIKEDLLNAYSRTPGINTVNGENLKLYFDNSSINPVFDVIKQHIESISRLSQFNTESESNKKLVQKLRRFFNKVKDGYIEGEALDTLLVDMGKRKNMSDEELSKSMIYLKAIDFAGVPQEIVCNKLNQPHNTIQNFHQNQESFIVKHYNNPSDPKEKQYLAEYIDKSTSIRCVRTELIELLSEIKILLSAN